MDEGDIDGANDLTNDRQKYVNKLVILGVATAK